MVVTKNPFMKELPKVCDECMYYSSRPHPYKGWTDMCELCCHCMDDDEPSEWIYDGNTRPKACPLAEVDEENKIIEYTEFVEGSGDYYECKVCGSEFYGNSLYSVADKDDVFPNFCPKCGRKCRNVKGV